LYRPTIGYFQHFGTSITNAYSTHFVKSSGLNAKAKFHRIIASLLIKNNQFTQKKVGFVVVLVQQSRNILPLNEAAPKPTPKV